MPQLTPHRRAIFRPFREDTPAAGDYRQPPMSSDAPSRLPTRQTPRSLHLSDAIEVADEQPVCEMTGAAAVVADGLVKHYESRSGVIEAVRGVDLAVESGEIFGFLGPNGAGKSTTVKMLTTLLSITSGTATVAGIDVARQPDEVRRRIGVALQEAGLDPRQTGRELLILQGRLFGMATPDSATRAQELLALVELEDAADRRIKDYSGGMKRRLDLASALVHQPEVLFLDEPTTGLDPASRLTVWDEVRRINELGTTVFLTTQYLEEADQLCDRLAIIDDGRIVREGTPARLKAELRERRGMDTDPTLDDVFLDATGRTRDRGAGEVQEVLG
jgi:ABC-2 type transport system ATP-binding protein